MILHETAVVELTTAPSPTPPALFAVAVAAQGVADARARLQVSVKEAYASKLTLRQIAGAAGVCPEQVRRILAGKAKQ